ncbi:hypothetical protein Salat_1993000 [Sesamum alatum]|uniref:Uncharacterized protein n=1 Tax=Sesamum alatum TaxID=300844 RepID=A0AAE1XYU4_9LAMI|nr:hypothetical protein Salat_1993000 [Sesamum alatum]
MVPLPAGEVVRTKLVRLLYFVGAGAVCAAAINKWKDMERKSMIQKYQQQLNGPSSESQSNVIPFGKKPVKLDEEERDSADEEKPQVDEDIEVKRMRRLEQLGSGSPFGAISEDGSCCVSVLRNDTLSPRPEQQSDDPADADLSPPWQSRKHHWSPPRNVKNDRSGSIVSARKSIHDLDDYDTVAPAPSASDLSPRRKRPDKITSFGTSSKRWIDFCCRFQR